MSETNTPEIVILPSTLPTESVSPPSYEQSISRKYKDCRLLKKWKVNGKTGGSPRTVHDTIYNLFADEFKSKGNVYIKQIKVTGMSFAENSMLGAAVHASNFPVDDWDDLAALDNHQMHYSVAANQGVSLNWNLVIPESCSRQVNPPSAFLPAPSLWLQASANAKFHGLIEIVYDCSMMVTYCDSAF